MEGNILLTGNRWTLVQTFNLSQMQQPLMEANNNLHELRDLMHASNLFDPPPTSQLNSSTPTIFRNIYSQIAHHDFLRITSELAHAEQTLQHFHDAIFTPSHNPPSSVSTRSKRGLFDFGGTALKWLFGVPDSTDLAKIHHAVSNQHHQTQLTAHLIHEQASVLNASLTNIYKNQQLILRSAAAHNTLEKNTTELSQSMRTINNETQLLMNSLLLTMQLHTLSNIIQDVATETALFAASWSLLAQNKLSEYFIPPEGLLQALIEISKHLPADMQLPLPPLPHNIPQYYSLAQVTVATFNNQIRIFTEIPISGSNNIFSLYRTIPLPTLLPNSQLMISILPDKPFFAISQDGTASLELDFADLEDCITSWIRVCPPRRHAQLHPMTSCTKAVFTGDTVSAKTLCRTILHPHPQPTFFCAKNSNHWLFSVPSQHSFVLHCPTSHFSFNTTALTHFSLTNAGELTLPPKCWASSSSVHLLPYSNNFIELHSSINRLIPPPQPILPIFTNLTINFSRIQNSLTLSEFQPSLPIANLQNSLQNLDEKARLLESPSLFVIPPPHTILHLFTTLFLSLFFAAIIFLSFRYKHLLTKIFHRKRQQSIPNPIITYSNKSDSHNAPLLEGSTYAPATRLPPLTNTLPMPNDVTSENIISTYPALAEQFKALPSPQTPHHFVNQPLQKITTSLPVASPSTKQYYVFDNNTGTFKFVIIH